MDGRTEQCPGPPALAQAQPHASRPRVTARMSPHTRGLPQPPRVVRLVVSRAQVRSLSTHSLD